MAGGASFSPRRRALPAEATEALSRALCLCTAMRVFTKKTVNMSFPSAVLPGEKTLRPASVLKDQLQCLPDPFTPSKGFSCNNTLK